MTEQPSTISFDVRTDPGDGPIRTDRFVSAQERLESLRQRAREYFPGATVPQPRGGSAEDVYLAQLLGFFLMLTDGKVTLHESTDTAQCADPR